MSVRLLDVDLLKELHKDNQWWVTNKIPDHFDKPFHRSDFYVYTNFLDSKDVQVIIGPRRVGKTVLMYQLIKHLLEQRKVEQTRIVYLDLGKPYLDFNIGGIDSCLKIYQDSILKTDFSKLNERVYLFIDEVQREENWAAILESYRSRNYPISFIVTGSSGTEIDKKASESLVGRSNFRYILPLKFKDVVRKKLSYEQKKLAEVKEITKAFELSVKSRDIAPFYEYLIKELFSEAITNDFEIKVKNFLDEYFLKGGYPEFYEEYANENWYVISKRMRDDYFQRIMSRDIVESFKVTKPEMMRKLYLLIASDTSGIANFSSYAEILNASKPTVVEYFDHLRRAFLVSYSEKYYKNKRPKNAQKKVYVVDIGMRNAVLAKEKSDIENEEAGQIAETIAQSHSMRLKHKIHPSNDFNLEYWRDKKEGEVDIIITIEKGLVIPIEVKYKEQIRSSDKKALTKFLHKNKQAPFGILITKKELNMEGNILLIPLWLYLLMC